MSNEIVYEEVEVTEEVYRGTLILDERLTPRQQRRKIFNMMRKEAGIKVENESEYKIGYEGVEDNNGLSETQTTEFVVTRTYKKKVPFKVTREEVYKGTYVLDGLRITPEEQREQIFNLMRDEGYQVENEDEYEIGYEGADDNNGISETQTTEFVVYHVTKERIDEDELAIFENDDNNKIPDLYNEMLSIRDELEKAKDSTTLEELASRVDAVTDRVDEIVEQKIKDYGIFEQEIESLDEQIKEKEERMLSKEEEYVSVYEELKELSETEGLDAEELTRKRERIEDKLQTIRKEKDRAKKELSSLKGKRTKVKNDLETARMLDLSADEYNDLVSNLRKKGILEAIYEKKGLADIISIPARDRTREEKKQLKEAKEEIMSELAKLQNEDSNKSVLDNIEALYGLEFERVRTNGRERILIVRPESYKNMVINANNLPVKVKMKAKEEKVDYVPGEIPEDLKDAFQSTEVSEKVLTTGRVHIDDIYLRGLSEAETQARYEEEAIKDAASNGVIYNPETMSINFSGAEVDEAASDIQYQGYSIVEKTVTKEEPTVEPKEVVESTEIVPVEAKTTEIVPVQEKTTELTEKDLDQIANVKPEVDLSRDVKAKITIFVDDSTGKLYARMPVFARFDIEPTFERVRIDGVLCSEILPDEYEEIKSKKDNAYSPYIIDEVHVPNLDKDKPKEVQVEPEEKHLVVDKKEPMKKIESQFIGKNNTLDLTRANLFERITIFIDDSTGKIYARMPVFDRLGIEPSERRVNIAGSVCAEIYPEEYEELKSNMGNDYSPYILSEIYVPRVEEIYDKKGKPSSIIIATSPKLIIPTSPKLIIATEPHKMPQTGVAVVKATEPKPAKTEPQAVKTEPKPVKTEPKARPTKPPVKVAPKKKVKPHVEEIIAKLTKGLDIRAKDSKRYNASNIKVAKSFKQELSSGNYLYNIVHIVPTIIKTSINIFRKLGGSLLTTKRGRNAMDTIKERLDNLTEDELEVLFNEYKGSVLKTDMNNQINSLILDRLRRYGLEKVQVLNDKIEKNYAWLFSILGQLKVVEARLEKSTDKKEREALETLRDKYNERAAMCIRHITDDRTAANNLLSGGVHGLEEDFKAVSTKMNYVGLRFGKSHDFDDELQQKLGVYGRNLNVALADDNNEEIVKNFMGLESCYYDNTEIRGSVVGKRSVGTKYYSPLAEQFDYRDDPFIRDLFTTVAVTTATISAINALRNQQILAEHNKAIAEHNEKVADANAMNEAMAKTARDTGRDIADKRDTFREGMASQSQHDILTNANTRERAHLDTTNWQFNDQYHVIDPAGHEAYNQFGDRVSSEIEAVTADYARGAITAQQAFEKIEYISSNANTTLNGVINECLPILRQYAQTHPQFDLHAVEQSMQYISANPNALANMNHAMVDVTNLGESLTTLQATQVEALALLPPEMSVSIIGAASSAALAGIVASQLSKGPLKKTQYGNEVTDMMDEYMAGREAEEENQRKR